MKRMIALLLCLLLAFGCTLSLTACSDDPPQEPDTQDEQEQTDDLSAVEDSDAAYLLDPEYKFTEENIFDCLYDYFTAPGVLSFGYRDTLHMDNPEQAAAFAEAFRDVPLRQTETDEYDLDTETHRGGYSFENAIGTLQMHAGNDVTYITFSRDNDRVTDEPPVYFVAEENLVKKVKAVDETLDDYLLEPRYELPPSILDDYPSDYDSAVFDALPEILESDAAYLLDPNFVPTEETIFQCISDYLTAPGTLYLGDITYIMAIDDPEIAARFIEVFRDTPLTAGTNDGDFTAGNHRAYGFTNAIGHLRIYCDFYHSYITFSRDNEYVHDESYFPFFTEENLLRRLYPIEEGLSDVGIEKPGSIPMVSASDFPIPPFVTEPKDYDPETRPIPPATPSDLT